MNPLRMRRKTARERVSVFVLCLLLGGCMLTPPPTATPPVTPELPTALVVTPDDFSDAAAVMAGICFEAAYAERGRILVLTSAIDHIRFYDGIDASSLCRWPVERVPFDFTDGRALVGTWSYGTGCTAQHTLDPMVSDADTQTLRLVAHFSTAGDCAYELLRPLWLGVTLPPSWTVTLTVEG